MIRFQSPVNDSFVNRKGHPSGDALDLGWFTARPKTKNQDVFAVGNGTVLWADFERSLGNGIVTKHDWSSTHDMWVGMGHFLNLPTVKKGATVKQGQKIANMGMSGTSFGEHVHVRMSLVPKGTSFSWANFNKYDRLNPLNYLYEYPHQYVEDMQKLPKETVKEESKPSTSTSTSKPKAEYVTVSGKYNLYKASTGTEKYGKANQNLASRNMEVLGRANGRVRVNAKPFYKMVKGKRVRVFDVDSFWLDLGDKKPAKKPTTSKPKVTKIKVSGNTRLFVNATGSATYPHTEANRTFNHYTNLEARTLDVIKTQGNRYQVRIKNFDPEVLWIDKADVR